MTTPPRQRNTHEQTWLQQYEVLRSWADHHGHTNVPQDEVVDEFALGLWVVGLRAERRRGRLTDDRAAELEALPGWVWNAHNAAWEKSYLALRTWVARHGHANVPAHETVDGFRLGRWVTNRRSDYRRGKLSGVRVAALESLPGWTWDGRGDDWDDKFEHLQGWVTERGRIPPRRTVVDGIRIGYWVSTQRKAYQAQQLPPERIAALEGIPGWAWDGNEASWESGIAAVHEWIDEHGDSTIPATAVVDGFRLGDWINNRRTDYREHRLSSERIAALEALPGWVWSVRTAGWNAGFTALQAWVTEHGHATVPSATVVDEFQIGRWVVKQRQKHRIGHLTQGRTEALEALPGWVWATR